MGVLPAPTHTASIPLPSFLPTLSISSLPSPYIPHYLSYCRGPPRRLLPIVGLLQPQAHCPTLLYYFSPYPWWFPHTQMEDPTICPLSHLNSPPPIILFELSPLPLTPKDKPSQTNNFNTSDQDGISALQNITKSNKIIHSKLMCGSWYITPLGLGREPSR